MEERYVDIPDFRNRYLLRGALTGKNAWWRYVLGILYCAFGYLTFQILAFSLLSQHALKHGISQEQIMANPAILFDPDAIGMNKSMMLVLLFGMFVFAFIGLVMALRGLHRKPLISVATASDYFRWDRYGFAFTIWALLSLVYLLTDATLHPGNYVVQWNPQQFGLLAVVMIVFVPIQTATEELLFRGYMLQGLSQVFKSGLAAVLITSLLFGLAHMSNPEVTAHGWKLMLPIYTFTALYLGLIVLLDEGLELAMGIHMANNLVNGLFITSDNSVFQTDALLRVKTETPMADFIGWICMALVCFGILWLRYRWKNFKHILK